MLPGRHWRRDLTRLAQSRGQQGDEREQGQRGASSRLVRPLALSSQPEVGSTLRKSDPDRPAHDGPRQDLHQARLKVGLEERFHWDHPHGIAHGGRPIRSWAVLALWARPRPMIERRTCAGEQHRGQERELGMGQTRRARSCAKGAKTSMMASTRDGMRCPPPRA